MNHWNVKNAKGQALIEWAILVPLFISLWVVFITFTQWFLIRQELLAAAKEGAFLYSSGRMTADEVKNWMEHMLLRNSLPLQIPNQDILIGASHDSQAKLFQLDRIVVRYQPSAFLLKYFHNTLEETCTIKHAPPYRESGLKLLNSKIGPGALAKRRLSRWLLVALTCALLAGMGLWMLWPTKSDQEISDSRPILIANDYIPAFSVVTKNAVTLKNYPPDLVPPGALQSIKELVGDKGQVLYVSMVAIPSGQPITHSLLSELNKNRALSGLLSSGQVAVSFAVDKVSGAGGWVIPGDRIAIFQTSHLLFSSVEVIAIDRNRLGNKPPKTSPDDAGDSIDASENGASILTVLMNPIEATALIEARNKGLLSVVLRAMGDDFPWEAHGQ